MIRVAISSPRRLAIDRRQLRQTVRSVLQGEAIQDAEISLALVDNTSIHAINRRYLDHDEPTDVITFPLDSNPLSGELVIGWEVAQQQANRHGHDWQTEVLLYVIHGLLHLCGYGDKKKKDAQAMHDRERHYLRLLGLPEIAP